MEKCGYRSVIACSARGYFCSIDVNLTMRRLVIVGYGFGDEHINAVIAKAVEKHGLKVFVWSNSDPKDRILATPHGLAIWNGLLSTVTEPMVEVFPPNQDITEEYRRIRRVVFGDQRF
jgi:hypothetical protein